MCQLWHELPPEEAWLGTSAECWGDWSCILALTTKFTGGLCWDRCPCSISPLSGCRDTFWGLDDIYWCSFPGWTVLQFEAKFQAHPPMGWSEISHGVICVSQLLNQSQQGKILYKRFSEIKVGFYHDGAVCSLGIPFPANTRSRLPWRHHSKAVRCRSTTHG